MARYTGRNALVRMPGSPRQHNRGGEQHHDARRSRPPCSRSSRPSAQAAA